MSLSVPGGGVTIGPVGRKLYSRQWGDGDRVAVLVHGLLGESRQFHAVGPRLANQGYRTIAVDLPGHGHSFRDPQATLASAAKALVDSVPARPTLIIAHDLGGVVVAAALERLAPRRCVYVDVAFLSPTPPTVDHDLLAAELTEHLALAKMGRTVNNLRRSRPAWSHEDRLAEAEAARLFHVPTAVSLISRTDADPVPLPDTTLPSLIVRSENSRVVSSQKVGELQALGFTVTTVPTSDHVVFYTVDAFFDALNKWL